MKRIYVEIDGVFYKSCNYAGRIIGCSPVTIRNRYLSEKFPNYKTITLKPTERRCATCGEVKLLKKFGKASIINDGFRTECKKCRKKYEKGWYYDNLEHVKEYRRQPEIKNKNNKRKRERRKTDIAFRLNEDMSATIGRSLRGKKNGAPWETLVGYTCKELIAHLENLFTDGMSWDNWGYGKYKWNLDHIIAIYWWDITSYDCQELKDCWALENLQPLWQVRNFEKGTKPMEPKYLIKPDCIK